MIKITYYLDVISSWCHYVEPLWEELKSSYKEEVEFDWEITLIPANGLPGSAEEEEWYYRRSGMMTQQAKMLNATWVDPKVKEYLSPNLVAYAAKTLGENGDKVRVAIAKAAILDGKPISDLDTCIEVALGVCDINPVRLTEVALDPLTEQAIRKSTARFEAYGINQRPAFILESEIEDRAIFSGIVHREPLVATIEAMIDDVKSHRSWSAHMGSSWKDRAKI